MNIRSFREKYPQYNDMTDIQVADKLYNQHGSSYPELSKEKFYEKFGVQSKPSLTNQIVKGGYGVAKDITGGTLAGLKDTLSATPDLQSIVSANMKKIIPFTGGKERLERIDPYAIAGTTNKPWNTPGGAVQTAFELIGPGEVAKPAIGLAKRGLSSAIENVYHALTPDMQAKKLMSKLSGGKSLEEHGKEFANKLKDTYTEVKNKISNKYNNFFAEDNLGNKELYPEIDKIQKGGKYPVNSKSRYYRETPDFSNSSAGQEYQDALESFNKKPTVKNAHELRSEMSSEERQIQKQIDRARNEGQPTTQLYKDLKDVKADKEKLSSKMKEIMGDKASEYNDITNEYLSEVVPWHGDRILRNIVSGRAKNPPKENFENIFKYADDDTKKILEHLGPESKNDVLTQALGIQPELATGSNLSQGIKRILSSGFEHYGNQELKKQANRLGDSNVKRALKIGGGVAGIGTIEEAIRRMLFQNNTYEE
jgi:hypothetical protein